MDPQELKAMRRAVLVDLLDRWKDGEWSQYGTSQDAFARLVGVQPSTVTRWKSYPDPANGKAIGDKTALRIETALDLTPGTMMLPELAVRELPSIRPAPPAPAAPPGPAPDVHFALEAIARRLMSADTGTRELVAGMLASMAKNPESYSRVATGLQAILSDGHSDEAVERKMPATKSLKRAEKQDADQEK